jgi:TRADD-N domain-containing protein
MRIPRPPRTSVRPALIALGIGVWLVASVSWPVEIVYYLTQVGLIPYRKDLLEEESFRGVYSSEISTVKTSIFWLGLVVFIYLAISSLLRTYILRSAVSTERAREELHRAEAVVASRESLELSDLWAVTQRRLDYYHQIATGQARQSFRNAQIAMSVGFAILLVFAFLAANSKSTAGSIVAGSLGASSAALTAYVGRTFIRSQENAAAHLKSYFLQPLEFSRYLAAERAITSLPEGTPQELVGIIVEAITGKSTNEESNQDSSNESSEAERK